MNIEWKQLRRVGIAVFAVFLAIYYWSGVEGMILTLIGAMIPLFIGIVIAYMLNILMDMYEDYFFPKSEKEIFNKIRRPVCLCGAIVTVLLILGLLIYLVIPELVTSATLLVDRIPNGIEALSKNTIAKRIIPPHMIDRLMKMNWEDYINAAIRFVKGGAGSVAGDVMDIAGSVFSNAVSILLGLIFAIYFLGSKEKFQKQALRVLRVAIKEKYHKKLLHYATICNNCFHNYIVGKLVDALIVGLLCAVGMLIFRLPYVLMVSIFVGFTTLVPIVGSYLGIAVGTIIIFTDSPAKALIFFVFIIVMTQFEANVIYPKLMSNSIGLPGIWVLAAVTVGGTLLGIFGMLIGVPIAATIYQIAAENVKEREDKLGLEELPDISNTTQERWQKIKQIKNKAKEKRIDAK